MLGRILIGSVVAVFVTVVVVTVAALQDRDGVPAGVLAGRSPQPTPTGAVTAPTTIQPAALTRRAASRSGYDRISSAKGGWSIEIPESWVAETGNLRGAEIASFNRQGTDFSGNAPAADQLRIRVTVMPEYDSISLADLGAKGGLSSPGPVIYQVVTTVASQPAVRTLMRSSSPHPFDQQHVYWHLRSPFFVDRVDRVAAKLVSYHEYEVASNFGHNYTQDPDDLVWVVATTGEFMSVHSRPLPINGTPGPVPPDRMIVQVFGSSSGDYVAGMYSPQETWPAWFD